ncbi:MAG: polymer-forming cytoskeletal protein [Pseudomonadota bacterium]
MSNPYDSHNRKKSVLGPTLKFKGELSADEDLLIQGQIEGNIRHSSNLTIGEEGKLKANVDAVYIAVEGEVRGDLRGSTSIIVKDTADIEGNIISPTVSLYEGATFNGSITMKDPAEVKVAPKPPVEEPVAATATESSIATKPAAADKKEPPADDSSSTRKRRTSRKSASAA